MKALHDFRNKLHHSLIGLCFEAGFGLVHNERVLFGFNMSHWYTSNVGLIAGASLERSGDGSTLIMILVSSHFFWSICVNLFQDKTDASVQVFANAQDLLQTRQTYSITD